MRKFLLTATLLLMTIPAQAQYRGPLPNVFASWVSVTQDSQTITFPGGKSRDVHIHNGSAVDVFVSLKGGTIADDGFVNTPNSTFMLNGTASATFSDLVVEAVSFKSTVGTASPVSVVVTY